MYNVIIAEDDEIMARILYVFLKNNGFNVTRFKNGQEAFDYLLTAEDAHLLVTDVLMPEMSGFELIAKLKKENKLPPTIVVTGQQREADVLEGLNSGALDYMAKPISPKVLIVKIKNILDANNIRSQVAA